MRIQSKLMSGFLLVAIVSSLVGIVLINSSQKAMEEAIGKDSMTLSSETIKQIDKSIENRIDEFQWFAATSSITNFVKESNKEFEALENIQAFIDQKDMEWRSVPSGETSPFMRDLFENELSDILKEKMNLYSEKYGYFVIGEVFVTNKYGANIGQSGRTSDYMQDDEEWWWRGKEDGLFVQDVEFDKSADVFSTDIIVRIDDKNGDFLGVMKIVLNVEEFLNILKNLEKAESLNGRTLESILLTRDGRVIYSTNDYERFENASHFLEFERGEQDFFVIRVNEKHGDEELFAHAHSGGYREFRGFGWILILSRPTSELFVSIFNLNNLIISLSFLIALFAIFLGFSMSRTISRPVVTLRDAAEKISKGDLNVKIPPMGKDEIGDLASSFNKMTKDLKQNREEIRKHSRILEDQVKERTADLDKKVDELTKTKTAVLNMMEDMDESNKDLTITQEKLKEMDAKKDQFISIAAHELKTPLTSLHGFSQLLRTSKNIDKEKRDKYLMVMERESTRLANLVNDILDLSRIDIGTMKFTLENVNVKGVVEQVRNEMNVHVESKGLVAKYEVGEGIPVISTERERLTQVLINLINNAVKYTPKGKITVKVFMDKGNVHFMIKDTGIGIAKNEHEKIFERFYQVDSSYTRKAGGTGIGLSLCKELVEKMGGKIWVVSDLGKGSEFHFTVPVKHKK